MHTKQRKPTTTRQQGRSYHDNSSVRGVPLRFGGASRSSRRAITTTLPSLLPLSCGIGLGMTCLGLVYIVAVLSMTTHTTPTSSTSRTTTSTMVETQDATVRLLEPAAVLQQQQRQQQQQHVATTTNDKGSTLRLRKPIKRIDKVLEKRDTNVDEDNKEDKTAPTSNHLARVSHEIQQDLLLREPDNKDSVSDVMSPQDKTLQQRRHPTPDYILTAYQEPLNLQEWEIKPLPVRSQAKKENLVKVTYPKLQSCRRLPEQWPVDDRDESPVDHDPFLPWIHDVFPTADGKFIQFVAQNKRRCDTGRHDAERLKVRQPQAALFQHVPIRRILQNTTTTDNQQQQQQYQLTTHELADSDGIATRFICRFKPTLQETLSVFNFDYDWTTVRKLYKGTFHENDGGILSLHTSQLIFKCPVPDELQEQIRTGSHMLRDDWTTLFVDLIPIRTPPRYGPGNQFLQPNYKEMETTDPVIRFDPRLEWGNAHVLPAIEDSGRWENIPICLPSLMQYENQTTNDLPADPAPRQVKHHLVSCIWASAGYATRGDRFSINDGQRRLLEWISYNKVVGFDHFYLYDNSGAFSNNNNNKTMTSLKPIADLFPGEVTYIPWPSKVCNNRKNCVDSPGERSSQYAAESSCRLRFGPHVDWIGQVDIDEYLVPMGKYETITSLLDELDKEDIRIISSASWRAWPRANHIEPIEKIDDKDVCWKEEPCFDLRIPKNTTFLQAYNCDRQQPGKKTSRMPAEKQIYRPDYVLQHFVHYSAATVLSDKNKTEWAKEGRRWKHKAFPDPRQRFGDETTEILMIHSKAVAIQDTSGWERVCGIEYAKSTAPPGHKKELCRLGYPWPKPWPENPENATVRATAEGWAFNCYVNPQVEDLLVPRLEKELAQHSNILNSPR